MKMLLALLSIYFLHIYIAMSAGSDGLFHPFMPLCLGFCVCLRFALVCDLSKTSDTCENPHYSPMWY